MACGNCGGQRAGFKQIWEYRLVGESPLVFATQADAVAQRQTNGGRGIIIKAYRKIT